MPKRTREVLHTYTQAELISRALDTEEGNILEHRNYLDEEEEKRKRAKVVRKAVTGPVLRYISKIGEDKITIPVKPPPPPPPPKMLPMIPLLEHSTDTVPSASNANGYGVSTSTNTQTPQTSAEPQTRTEIEKVTKNYLVHEIDQMEEAPKPLWNQTMSAVFGDHVKWDKLKVYTSRHRPFGTSLQPS